MANQYEPFENFHTRLKVETVFAEGDVRDHRTGDFYKREYERNQQRKDEPVEPAVGFPSMKGVVNAPKPKGGTKQVSRKKSASDQKILDANNTDLKNRNLK